MSQPRSLESFKSEPPTDPRIPGYFERDAQDLATHEMSVSAVRVGIAVALAKKFIKNVIITPEDLRRHKEYTFGPVIECPNHDDFLNIAVMGMLRELSGGDYPRYIGKASLNPYLGRLGLVPVDRSDEADPKWGVKTNEIMRYTLAVEQRPVVIFGESTIFPEDHDIHPLEPGLSVFARRHKVDILPIGIFGTQFGLSDAKPQDVVRLIRNPRTVAVCVGEPVRTTRSWYEEQGISIPRNTREFGEFILETTRESMQEQYNRARDLYQAAA